jgi:hypothetical protein
MPTNEAGLSEGQDMGDGGRTEASDMPGGERNDGPSEGPGAAPGQDPRAPIQTTTEDGES